MMFRLIILYLQILELNLSFALPVKFDENGFNTIPKEIANNPGFGFINTGTDIIVLVPQLDDTTSFESKDKIVNGIYADSYHDEINSNRNLDLDNVSDFSASGSDNTLISIPIFHDVESLLESISVNDLTSTNIVNNGFSRIGRSKGSNIDSHKAVQNDAIGVEPSSEAVTIGPSDVVINRVEPSSEAVTNSVDLSSDSIITGTSTNLRKTSNGGSTSLDSNFKHRILDNAILESQSSDFNPLSLSTILPPDASPNTNLVNMLRTVTGHTNERTPSLNIDLRNTQSAVPLNPMVLFPVMCNSAVCSAVVPTDSAHVGEAVGRSGNVESQSAVDDTIHYLIAVTCSAGICTANKISSSTPTAA